MFHGSVIIDRSKMRRKRGVQREAAALMRRGWLRRLSEAYSGVDVGQRLLIYIVSVLEDNEVN